MDCRRSDGSGNGSLINVMEQRSEFAEQSNPSHSRDRLDWYSLLGPYLGLAVVVLVFSILTWDSGRLDFFLSLENLRLILLHMTVTTTVALGMTMIMISGGIDLSVGYVVSLVTVVTTLTFRTMIEADVAPETASLSAIGAGLLTGVFAGFCNGMAITKLKVVPFVATLGMLGIARGVGQYLSGGTRVAFPGGEKELPVWVPALRTVDPNPEWLIIGLAPWSVIILAIIVAIILRYTILGRYCYAIGSNESTARLCGIHVGWTKVLIYSLAGLATGWAGIIQTARSTAGTHDVQAGLELEVIAAVVIGGGSLSGGKGTVSGTIVGALMLAILDSGCSTLRLSTEFRFIVIGLIIILVAALNNLRQRQNN